MIFANSLICDEDKCARLQKDALLAPDRDNRVFVDPGFRSMDRAWTKVLLTRFCFGLVRWPVPSAANSSKFEIHFGFRTQNLEFLVMKYRNLIWFSNISCHLFFRDLNINHVGTNCAAGQFIWCSPPPNSRMLAVTVNFTRQAFLGIAVSSYHQILLYLQFPFPSAIPYVFHAGITHTAGLIFPQRNGRLREVYIGLMAEAARVECDFDPIWFSFEQLFGNICLL